MKMSDDCVFTQTKKVIMTSEKTAVICTDKLELVDGLGRRKVVKEDTKESTVFHDNESRWCA